MALVWLIAMIVLLVIEGIVPGLISIWFALGALAALIAAALHAPMWLQLLWFLVVSVVALAATRPLVKKYVNSRVKPTNADMILGKDCVVTEEIDNIRGTGAVTVGGKVWTARMENDEDKAAVGEILQGIRIEGVKLIVRRQEEQSNM
jgi:membrane protein implicated in regulation of membrane protease activity